MIDDQLNLAGLIAARKAASTAVDSSLQRNHPLSNSEMFEYIRLAYEYVAAAEAVMEAYDVRRIHYVSVGDHQLANHRSAPQMKSAAPR